ncbi:transcriptional regulator [Hoyosella sp. YIM 151337]|uniref:helix-turn-helix transcriptional regulator n=1 Tax=Hoyosella sp. YIM 151337 TaxID=2992742 RepID=UPI0022355852|nr:metalloregulator ArsR/SmtB family transcription factor [Hoyosella sp. YIM 151337]MCW4353167.1 transcriptional regulator [Hoyosella sp. YIM 151337]
MGVPLEASGGGAASADAVLPTSRSSRGLAPAGFSHEGRTRAEVVRLLLERGPITASAIGARLGLSAAGVRRHLDVLIDNGYAEIAPPRALRGRGRGRPAKQYMLSAAGRDHLRHAYDDLATAAMRELREIGGDAAVARFADRRVRSIVGSVQRDPDSVEQTAERVAEALTAAGYAASTRRVGLGVEICQHHCPVSHVAEQFPQLCEAEEQVFAEVLGTHVQRLATIANGDCACTTHVPLQMPQAKGKPTAAQPAAETQRLREERT